MADHSESGLPLGSIHPEGNTSSTSTLRRKRRKDSQSSDDRVGGTKSTSSRRRPGTKKEASFGPQTGGESSTMQPSMSPEANAVHYTRTGRISKAKKGLKVHNCDCGRSYTRAEHLRRHQKNHAQDALVCDFPECGKTFYRIDLLQRHQERHNEIGKDSRRESLYSQGTSAEVDTPVSAPVSLPAPLVTTVPQASPYYPSTVSPLPEPTQTPRYTSNQFRTPTLPSSAFGHHLFRSSLSSNHHKQQQRSAYPRGQTSVSIPVQVDGLGTGIAWNDPFNVSQSPNYSSSSGYASPVPGTGDYANMFANPPFGAAANRTRTSSNASFIEPWGYPSRSPTSATSTMAYTWTSSEKNTAAANVAYMANTSYPMTSVPLSAGIDPMSAYGHFGPKSMAQRDDEEQAFLFPEQSFGMGHIANTSFEQDLDNYWRLFHPSFPVVHPATYDGVNDSPMLRAAMIAVGAQYSDDPSAKRKARILHDRCMKLLDKRDLDVMTEPERLCDYQSLFLIEVLSQYRARRAAKTLSTRFEGLYHKFSQDFRAVTSALFNNVNALAQPENAAYEHWQQWIDLSCQQRILLCCYVLEYQQAILLGRSPQASIFQYHGFDLPLPAHAAMWDAKNPTEWAMAAQQFSAMPGYVYEVTPETSFGPFDFFQSSLLIAAHYNLFNNPTPYLAPPPMSTIDHLLDPSPITKHNLWTAKLLHVTPIRPLLAISGESWILSEKVPSPQEFSSLKTTLRTWVNGLWSSVTDTQSAPIKDALRLSIELLQHAIALQPQTLRLELGADMGLYFAALVIWAVTVAANTRINASQTQGSSHRYPSQSPLPSNRNSAHYPSTPTRIPGSPSQAATSPNLNHPNALGLMPSVQTSPAPPPTSNSMLHSEITMTSVSFLNMALLELDFIGIIAQWPKDVAQWQQGCAALMRWVKMRLRNGPLDARDSVVGFGPTSAGTGRGGDGLGELLDGVISVLEKIMGRGWEGWGV
ncbi:fungal-specific transcription factor domain-containing protein [Lophiotrema nucula]|uniref:Fungal-specific transcription factor domain-containing protein n=1 Tax=Lophiotrema nucula TaxID=690887 RepID=A0A6A5ZIZ6_9PLEO|nr:fungal-specific transcription factor domain-containing protein [Lophiotrema nucula]